MSDGSKMVRWFAALLGLCLAQSGFAQDPLYRPLEVGDHWVYSESHDSAEASGCESVLVESYFQIDVLRDTVWNDAESRVVGCKRLDVDGEVLWDSTFVATLAFGPSSGSSPCRPVLDERSPALDLSERRVVIGGVAYTVPSMRWYSRGGPTGPGGGSYGHTVKYAEGIGITSVDSWQEYPSTWGGGCTKTVRSLEFAHVAGETYGRAPVAEESRPGELSPGLRVYPTPASSAFTIEAGTQMRVEVYDALGRLTTSGALAPGAPLRIDVSTWPRGLYVVRASGPSGVRSATVVVAR